MKNFKYTQHLLLIITTLMLSACITSQRPAPVSSGNKSLDSEPHSSAEPYRPKGGDSHYTPTPVYSAPSPAAATSTGAYVPSYAPVDVNATKHTVVRGDTVYNISKRYHISQDNLRQWNNIIDDTISVGQVLWVKTPNGNHTDRNYSPKIPDSPTLSQPVNSNPPSSVGMPSSQYNDNDALKTLDGVVWMKPAQGQLATYYSPTSKGIEIVGKAGAPIVAAADGKVIYSSTLDGYGKLIIIQHNTKYLTAYGNNQANLVKEGDKVKRGQKIATMGKTDASRIQLHFELRKDGQAVDPLAYIPRY